MKNRVHLPMVAGLFVAIWGSAATTVHFKSTDSLGGLRERLANDTDIREVVFAEGVYFGGLFVEGPKGTDFAKHPLVIRAADGAQVVFDGARPVREFGPHEKLPGVFWINYASAGGEYPKFWEPGRCGKTPRSVSGHRRRAARPRPTARVARQRSGAQRTGRHGRSAGAHDSVCR